MIQQSNNQLTNFTVLVHDLKIPTIAQIRALELLLNGNFGMLTGEQKEILLLILDSCKFLYKVILTLVVTSNIEENEMFNK